MLTFWLLTLQCCHHSLTILLSSQIYSEPSPIHCPHHQLYAGCHRPWKVYIQCFRKLISLTSHCIFADLIASRTQEEVIEFFFHSLEGSSFWNRFQFGCVFQDNRSRVCGTRASFCGQCKHNCQERGPHSLVWNVVNHVHSNVCVKVGDGTTSVTLLAGELLKETKSFVEDGVHPQIIIRSVRKATALVSVASQFVPFLMSIMCTLFLYENVSS